MTFLPIVDRELRVAARRRTTYLARIGAAALVILIFGGLQVTQAFRLGMFFTAGQTQFFVLKWLGFLFACSAGMFLTSDSLSEEKREGTLGLLFLTDLHGYDVVLGKFIGVYLGRPFEGWTYDRIMKELGEINYYVHERLGVPLIVTDDDISA